ARGDVYRGDGRGERGGDEQTQHRTVIELGLRIGRKMLIEDRDQLHAFEQWPEHRQRAKVAAFGRRLIAVPSKRHTPSMSKLGTWRKSSFGISSGCGKWD